MSLSVTASSAHHSNSHLFHQVSLRECESLYSNAGNAPNICSPSAGEGRVAQHWLACAAKQRFSHLAHLFAAS